MLERPMKDGEIVFRTESLVSYDVKTKATPSVLADLNDGFKVNCVSGSAGADVEEWSNVLFTKSGDVWSGGRVWPNSDPAYRFYGVFPSSLTMSYASGGATISASNTTDIVVAYLDDVIFNTTNSLSFSHIFARLKTVTVTAIEGYTISDVTIMLTPKVSGTYNLYSGAGQTDGTGWSSLSSGSPVNIASSTFTDGTSTKENDIWLVPGTYTLTASWTASKSGYEESFSDITLDVELKSGKTNNIQAYLTGDANALSLRTTMSAWSDEAVIAGAFRTGPIPDPLSGQYTVNSSGDKVCFSPGNLQAFVGPFRSDFRSRYALKWSFAKNQYETIGSENDYSENSTVDLFAWVGESISTDSYGLLYSSYSNFDTGQVIGESLKTDWGSIPGVVSSLVAGWRTMSRDEWDYLLNTRTVTNSQWSGARFILAQIDGTYNGIILFPDSYTHPDGTGFAPYRLYGEPQFNVRSGAYSNTTVSLSGWALMEAAGCVFLPAGGGRNASSHSLEEQMASRLYYWTSTSSSTNVRAYRLSYASGSLMNLEEANRYYESSVRLVKNVTP